MNEPDQPSRINLLLALQDAVISEWMSRVRNEVHHAQDVSRVVLVDTLPMFYRHLSALASGEESTYERSTIATEHGGLRARLTGFDAHSVAHELQLFRLVVLDTWYQAGIALSGLEAERVNNAVDVAIRDTIAGFVQAQTNFREQFFAALAHDLRTPLGTAATAVEMLAGLGDAHRIQVLAEVAARQLNLMKKMIDDLRDTMVLHAGTAQALEFSATDLRSLSEDVVSNAVLTSQREIVLSGESATGMWSERTLRRAMENLLNNAVKYSMPGTPIQVDISSFGGRVAWKVTNRGNAIPDEELEGLFQIFRRAAASQANQAAGWGIGLPYVRSVAERHGGSVVVTSNPRQTSFTLDLPLDSRPVLGAAP